MAEYGHVKISRKAYATDPFWTEDRVFSKWEAWEWLIQEAAWKERRRVIGMKVIPLARGELIASIRFLADAWGWKRSRVHEFLHLLAQMDRIVGQRETPEGTVYLLVKYSEYQTTPDEDRTENRTDSGTVSGQEADSDRTASGQKRSSKAVEAKKAGEGTEARKRAHPIPDLWRPNEGHAKIAAERGLDMNLEAEKMRDWALAKGEVKVEWDRAFNGWLRRAEPPKGGYVSSDPNALPVFEWSEEQIAGYTTKRPA